MVASEVMVGEEEGDIAKAAVVVVVASEGMVTEGGGDATVKREAGDVEAAL